MNNPDLYSEANGLQSSGVKSVLNDYTYLLNWDVGERVLDIGCGPGDTTCHLIEKILPKDVTITGCDISKQMITFANRTYGNERRKFVTLDISKPDVCSHLPAESFNKIFSFYCLHWVPNQRQCMRNISNLLKENGTALLCIPVTHECFTFYDTFTKKPEWAPYMKDIHGVSPYYGVEDPIKKFLDMVKDLPLKVIKSDIKPLVFRYTSLEAILDMMVAVNPYSDKMPEDVRQKFFKEMAAFFKDISKYEADGRIRSDYSVIVAVLQKKSK